MDRELLDLHRATLRALTRLMSQWSSLDFQRRITAQSGLTLDPVAVRALYGLGISGGSARPSDLADELHLTRPSTSKLIARLATADLIERRQDPADGRSAHIALTAAGRRTYEQLFEAGLALLAEATDDWDTADVRALSELLTRFTTDLATGASTTIT